MNRLAACLLFLIAVSAAAPAAGQPPSTGQHHIPTFPAYVRPNQYQPGYLQPGPGPAYSYGWFGVRPRRHWSRHFGYHRNYTEWSAQ